MIAYHYPPQAGSSGIQRSLSFSKHLKSFEWDPVVLSACPVAYADKNFSQLASIPPGLKVKRAFAIDAKRHLGIKGRYPGFLAIPDRWISWWFSAVPLGFSLIRKHQIPVIWSTYPIPTAHLIALTLRSLTGTVWIADFRDPMYQSDYPVTPLERKAYQWIERQTITKCDKAVFTSFGALDYYKARYPEHLHSKFSVIENGYDEGAFQDAIGQIRSAKSVTRDRIGLLHSGVLYPDGRNPDTFLEAIANLKRCGAVDSNTFTTMLRAPGDISSVQAQVRHYDLQDLVQVGAPIPYAEALREMLSVDGLLVFQGSPFNMQIPAKMYEYFRARKPIFSILDPSGETARTLRTAGFRNMAQIDDVEEITLRLREFIQQIRSGSAFVADDELVASSSRQHRAYQLSRLFNETRPVP